jgi:hypothetical protein
VRRIGVTLGVFVVALVVVAGAAGDQSYSDPVGDAAGGAPDVSAIRVVNDAAGTISFGVAVTGFPAADTFVELVIDSDRNRGTGDEDGDEFWFYIAGDDRLTYLNRWNGTDWVEYDPPSARVGFQNGVWVLSLNRADLGNTAGFDFYYVGSRYNGDVEIGRDDAPDGSAVYSYTLSAAPSRPQARTYEHAPRLPSRIRYVGNSIKHVRLGEKLYQTMKKIGIPRVVAVACWSRADWPSVVESAGFESNPAALSGFWLGRQPRWVHVAPKQCVDVQSLLSSRALNGQRAYALTTVLHERVHAQGLDNEAQTECYAVQLVYAFARELNFVHSKALRLEQLAVRKSRAVAPRGYWNASRCRDGGAWDLYSEFRNLTY